MSRLDLRPGGLADEVVSLRHWEERDVPALVRALQDGDVARWVLQIPSPHTEEHARSFLGMAAHARVIGAAAHLAVASEGTCGPKRAVGTRCCSVSSPRTPRGRSAPGP